MTRSQRGWVDWGISVLLVSILFWEGWIGNNHWYYYPFALGIGVAVYLVFHWLTSRSN